MGGKVKKHILPVLYDVRPVTRSGHLDVKKIRRIKSVLDLKNEYDFVDYQPSKNILVVQPKNSQNKADQEKVKLVSDRPQEKVSIAQKAPSKKFAFFKRKKPRSYSYPAGSGESLPSQKEILKELEGFNRFDNLLAGVSESIFEEENFADQLELTEPKREKEPKKKISKRQIPKKSSFKKEPDQQVSPFYFKKNEKQSRSEVPRDYFDNLNDGSSFRIEEFYFPEAADPEFVPESSQSDMPKVGLVREGRFSNWQRFFSFFQPNKLPKPKSFMGFILAGFLIALTIPLAAWLGQGALVKEKVMSNSLSAYQNLLEAKDSLEKTDWQEAGQNLAFASDDFNQAYEQIKSLGNLTLEILDKLPGAGQVSSGVHLVKVGEHLTSAGHTLVSALDDLSLINLFEMTDIPESADVFNYGKSDLLSDQEPPLTDSIIQSREQLKQALERVDLAVKEAEQVKVNTLPEQIQDKVDSLKGELPGLRELLVQAVVFSDALIEILGHDNPRQYLLIFQNNSELRATGGFIGTYGLLQFDQGRIRDLLIDGVFNADGQLHEKIIPPQPIQKISTAWSMHDANWFPDFSVSAQKIQWFYEKTGGITTDGVWSVTPVVVERLLDLTGPISMPNYGVELNSNNFVEVMQYKVEVDYDKRLNRPKKILADFTPLFLNALAGLSLEDKARAIEIIFNALEEKHILFYFDNPQVEQLIIDQGWAGQLKSTQYDYLSVVSSNINGYKTDRMIDESIDLTSEIQSDGSIVNTLTITRQHQGGEEEYDWWNRVNSNYLRVYIPKGSELISAKGHTIETHSPPIDYQEKGFKKDALVATIEESMKIDSKTGIHVFEESGKTVFGSWVYVSPGQKTTLTYQYRLPFKIDLTELSNSYSILIQKQAGSLGGNLEYQLAYPKELEVAWSHPQNLNFEENKIDYQGDLRIDRFIGATFKKQ